MSEQTSVFDLSLSSSDIFNLFLRQNMLSTISPNLSS